jgi:hypothetical protein
MKKTIIFLAIISFFSTAHGSGSVIQFVDKSVHSGVADPGINGSGPTFVDYDNDGDIDIYVVTEYHGTNQGNRLFENDGSGNFTDVALLRGVDNQTGLGRGASWGDYDNDGDADMVISNMPPSGRSKHTPTTLYRNLLIETGEPNFKDVTREANLMRAGNTNDQKIGGIGSTAGGVAWADYDNDGDLDLFWKCAEYDVDNALFRNNGDGTFTDVTMEAGVGILDVVMEANSQGSPNWTDVDQDGWLDLLITNEGDKKILFLNQGDSTFKNITDSFKPPSASAFLNPGNANGACIGDIDNDGDMDVFLPMADQSNRLYINQLIETGTLFFTDITMTSGVQHQSGARGCAMGDFDNDGLIDIYVNNGGLQNTLINDIIDMPIFVQFYIAIEPAYNKLFRNNGNLTFSDVTNQSGAEGFGVGSGVGAADINDDGFLDLFFTNRTFYTGEQQITESGRNYLLQNRGNDNNWIKIALRGNQSNVDGYGAKVKIVTGDLTQHREHTSAHGYNSGNDPRLYFGLSKNKNIDLIEVKWPSGKINQLHNINANQTLMIKE